MKRALAFLMGLALVIAVGAAPAMASHEIVIGLLCDRTGATQVVGVNLCPGSHDYVKLLNSKGGVEGHKIKLIEVDHEYKVPPAVEAYERFKKDGAVTVVLYGTPIAYALTQKVTEDRIPGITPGFGRSDATDGTRFPYIFPLMATYWSQATAAVQFAKEQLGGSLKGKKIAYLFFDNPAGQEPIKVIEDLSALEGFQLKTFAVPPPGVEMGAQALDIAQRYRADFVITHLFGRSPSVSIKELKRVGYPLRKVVSFVWGAAEADIEAAGGWAVAEGYNAIQFAGVGQDFPVIREIKEMYKKEGKAPPKEMASTVYYNRGIVWVALQIEAIRNALKTKPDGKITGADVKAGYEKVKGVTLGGLVPPVELTPNDHEGGGWVEVWQAKGGQFVRLKKWYKAYPEILAKHIKEAGAKK